MWWNIHNSGLFYQKKYYVYLRTFFSTRPRVPQRAFWCHLTLIIKIILKPLSPQPIRDLVFTFEDSLQGIRSVYARHLLVTISYICSVLEYNSIVWPPTVYLIDLTERVQRFFSRSIPSLSKLPYSSRLFLSEVGFTWDPPFTLWLNLLLQSFQQLNTTQS